MKKTEESGADEPPEGGGPSGRGWAVEGGYRSTDARKGVIDLLRKTNLCLTADEIHVRLRELGRRVGLATVYRTVNLLSEAGAIKRIDAGSGSAHFEAVEQSEAEHHHHIICSACNRVLKYAQFSTEELDLMKRTERSLEKRFGYRITGHRIYFEGVCPECLQKDVNAGGKTAGIT
jgi:Fur family transcriptional regulator, ferric uptake regulator